MSAPVERLDAAIEKLETLKAGSAPGEWEFDAVEKDIYDYNTSLQLALRPDKFMAGDFAANADLIVTLHRTIDAQLAILRSPIILVRPIDGQASFELGTGSRVRQALALADAILGGAE